MDQALQSLLVDGTLRRENPIRPQETRMPLNGKITTADPAVNMTSSLREVSEQDSLSRVA